MKRILILMLCILLLAGCANTAEPSPDSTAPTAVYDWMAGESPVDSRRTGVVRQGFTQGNFDVTADGIYFLSKVDYSGDRTYILYMDHGSDELVKLCGRPDCDHNNDGCNACVQNADMLTCYNGYLYTLENVYGWSKTQLIRMDLDGRNHTAVLDLSAFAAEEGGKNVSCDRVYDGWMIFGVWGYDMGDKGESVRLGTYRYKLDGSQGAPQRLDTDVIVWGTQNGDLITYYGSPKDPDGLFGIYRWDPEANTSQWVMDHPGYPALDIADGVLFFRDGCVYSQSIEDGMETVLLETDLTEDYLLVGMAECFMLVPRGIPADGADKNVYFYTWDYQHLDTVTLDYDQDETVMTELLLRGETAARIYLSKRSNEPPTYYIDKSELGTGKAKIHEIKIADDMAQAEVFLDPWDE